MGMREFLSEMEDRVEGKAGLLFEGGKEDDKVDASFTDELKEKGISKVLWKYQPEGFDLVVMEHDKDGEKSDSWSIAFFTEAEKGGDDEEENIFDGINVSDPLLREEVGMKMLTQTKGNFIEIIKICQELAENKAAYGKGFSSANIKAAVVKSKTDKTPKK